MSSSDSHTGTKELLDRSQVCQTQTFNPQVPVQTQRPIPQNTSQHAALISKTAEQMKPLLQQKFTDAGYISTSYVNGEDDFRLKMQAYLTLCDQQRDPNTIADFPQDTKTQQVLVQELVAAMMYLGEECEDAESKKSVNRIEKLSPLELDLMAWNLLFDTRDCQLGITGMPRWGKSWTIQECATFYERFELVKSALRCFKASVASLFDYTFSKRLALNPGTETGKIRGNKVVNSSRRRDLALAKEEKAKRTPRPGSRRSKKQAVRHEVAAAGAAPLQQGQLSVLTPMTMESRTPDGAQYEEIGMSVPNSHGNWMAVDYQAQCQRELRAHPSIQSGWMNAPNGVPIQGQIQSAGEVSTHTGTVRPSELQLEDLASGHEDWAMAGNTLRRDVSELNVFSPMDDVWVNQVQDADWA